MTRIPVPAPALALSLTMAVLGPGPWPHPGPWPQEAGAEQAWWEDHGEEVRSAGEVLSREAAPGASVSRDRLDAVERFVERNWSRLGLPGVAVGVATADSVVLALGYGTGTTDGGPITAGTPFHIGSVTKTFTAAVTAYLAREGALDLDDPVEAYLPDFTLRPPFTPGSIRIRHLLQHRSGLRQWSGHDRRAQRDGHFDHLAPAGPPGERGEYSSLNYIIVGRILEEASGEPYARLMERVLFRPLQMGDAFVEGSGGARPGQARGHQSWFGLQRSRAEPPPPRHLVPAGFAGASAVDLARYGGMLVGGGSFAGLRVLDDQAVEALLGPLDGQGPALGWGRRRLGGTLVLEHSGNARTASARMRLVPEEGYALVVLSNTNSGPFFGAPDALLDGIHAILNGEPEPRLWPRERLFKGVVLAGALLSVTGMARRGGEWSRAGYPVGIDGSSGTLGRLALDLGVGAVVVVGVPRYVGVPLPTLIEYFPDLGIALAASAGAGMVGGVLRAFIRSAR
jgi:CubicO group peptidase (beta-lactamase class C family)